MVMTILKFIWRWKAWLLVGILAIAIGIQSYLNKKEVIELEGVISVSGVDVMTCKGNLALCEQQFKNLSAQCKSKCPGMAGDINTLEKNYEESKKELLAKDKELKKYTQELLEARQDLASSGKIAWANTPEELQKQLHDLLGSQWDAIVEKIKKETGVGGVTATVIGIGHEIDRINQTVKKFRYYPKLKMGAGYNFRAMQVQAGVSIFSYSKIKAIDQTYLDFIEPYVAMDAGKQVGVGIIPISINLGGFLPVIKDLDLAVGAQLDFGTMTIRPSLGITSTF